MPQYGAFAPSDLPTMPSPRARGMVLLWNQGADLQDFLSVIEGDPALTASVLRAANSALSAPVEPVITARNAIVRIGLEGTRQITVAAMARAEFDGLDESGLDADDLWRWLLAVALLTEAFATHDGVSAPELQTAFTAGLLHQVGRLAFASRSPRKYQEVVDRVRSGADPLDAERELFGLDSVKVNEQIAFQWSLPSPLFEAVTTAERSPEDHGERSRLGGLVHEAGLVARALDFNDGFWRKLTAVPEPLADDHPRRHTIEALGGAVGIREQITWFRHATAPRESQP